MAAIANTPIKRFRNMMKKLLATIATVCGLSAVGQVPAMATPMDIHFTAAGSATGVGDLVVDSSLLTPSTMNCCGALPSGFLSLDLSLNFGGGATEFVLSDLSRTTYVLSTNNAGTITDLNFWGNNGTVTITGTSPFTESASGGATGSFQYTVTSVSAVPEPVSMALFGVGLVGLGVVRRRKAG